MSLFLTEDQLDDEFDRATLTRGRAYQQKGHVQGLSIVESKKGYMAKATVQGSRRIPYKVSIELNLHKKGHEYPEIYGSCSCPMAYDCKHLAATLYEIIDKKTLESTHADISEINEINAIQVGVDSILKEMTSTLPLAPVSEFDKWLNTLDSVLKTESASTTVSAPFLNTIAKNVSDDYQLIYILKNHPDKPAVLKVKLMVARKLKSGGFGNLYKELTYTSDTHMRALTSVDQDILHRLEVEDRLLNHHGHQLYQKEYDLIGKSSVSLLNEMVHTNRCYWNKHQGSNPLQIGSPIKGNFKWHLAEDGKQKLVCSVEGKNIQVLPLTTLWYLDLLTHSCGPLKLDIESELAKTLLFSPALLPQDVEKMEQLIQKDIFKKQFQTPSSAIPLPHHFETTELKSIKPKPKLFLFGLFSDHFVFYRHFGKAVDLPLGRISFIYEDSEVSIQDPLTIHVVDQKSCSMRVISRNLQAEGECIKQLLELGVEIFSKKYRNVQIYHVKPCDFLVAPIENETQQQNFLSQAISTLQQMGWEVVVDKSFPVRYLVNVDDWYTDVRETSQFDWFKMEMGFLLEGQKINILPLLVQLIEDQPEAFNEKSINVLKQEPLNLLLPNGQAVGVPFDRIKGILSILTELYDNKSLDASGFLPVSRLRAAQLLELEKTMQATRMRWLGEEKLKQLNEKLVNFNGIQPVTLPITFKGRLRAYQKQGLDWLNFLREYRLGGVLCDDMGLGKTIQTLAHLLVEKEAGRLKKPCLIIAPTSLMENWRQEAKQFTPSLKVLVLQGQNRLNLFKDILKADIVLTTYPLVVRDKEVLLENDYSIVILDEAQFAKNANTKAYSVLQQVRTQHRLCLTGTPIENHLGELWALFNFLSPGLLGESKQFTRIFRTPIEKHDNSVRRQSLHQRVKPYLLRRTKEAVAQELPPKTEMVHHIILEESQRDLYESIRLAMESKVQKAIQAKGFASSQIIILDALLKLRQVCCDPRLLKLEHAKKTKESAKLTFLMEMLTELVEEGRKILLFSSFTSMLALIEDALKAKKMPYVKLTGSTIDRRTPIAEFQSGSVPLFLISLKAGGTGLNLTAADTVIHYDPWWNPAAEAQATDRAHRIGQTKPVFVYKLVTTGTVEEKILKMQDKKRALMDTLFDETSGKKSGKISTEDLQFLFQPLDTLEKEAEPIP